MRVPALAVLALASMATGCMSEGEPLSRDDYGQELRAAYFEHRMSPGRGPGAVARLAAEARELTAVLEELEPPTAQAATHDRMVRALTDYGDDIASLASSPNSVQPALLSARTSLVRWQRALGELQDAGYTLPTP